MSTDNRLKLRSDDYLKLHDRLQVMRVSEHDYRLVALYESLQLNTDNGVDGILDAVLPLLSRGCQYQELFGAVPEGQHVQLARLVDDLLQHNLVEAVPPEHAVSAPSTDRLFEEQVRFFANFQALSDEPAKIKANGAPDRGFQSRLKAARVALIGAGRLGARLAQGLAQAGVGTLIIADSAPVTVSDTRDTFLTEADLGANRAQALCSRLAGLDTRSTFDHFEFGETAGGPLPQDLSLLVLCEQTYDPTQYRKINALCLEANVRWISGRTQGAAFEVGPLIVPYETACFTCLEIRRRMNQSFFDAYIDQQQGLAQSQINLGALNITLGYEVLALEAIKALTGFSRPMTYGAVYKFDGLSLEGKLHPVLKIPRCPACAGRGKDLPSVRVWRPENLLEGLYG